MRNELTRVFDLLDVISNRPRDQVVFSSVCNGQWRNYTAHDYIRFADRTSFALIHYGILKGEPIISITHNRAEFNFADMGILQAGAVHVPVYPGIDTAKLAAILKETGARIAFISNRSVLRKIQQVPECALQLIVSFDQTEGAISFEDFLNRAPENPESLAKLKSSVQPGDNASIIYLSGTNTPLRGVVLSHENHVFNILNYCRLHHMQGCTQSISFLPLAHSFERSVNYSFQYLGIKVCYSEGIASLPGILKKTKPDVMLAVPLVLERIIENTRAEIMKAGGVNGVLARFTLQLAAKQEAGPTKQLFSFKRVLYKLVFKGLRNFLGGNIKVMLCGGAALRPEVLSILWAAGIRTYEGYGLTEAGPLVSYNLITAFKSQSLGKLMPGVEVRISDDQEVLVKSGGIMKGYFGHKESPVDIDGWLHTGDIGELDEQGFLTLTGIKKEIFKLSSGLYTDPRPIEARFANIRGFRNIWIYGHNRISLTAVVVPEFSKNNELIKDKESVIISIEKEIVAYNSVCPKYDQIVKFEIVEDEWSNENGFLNADGSLNRQSLYKKYAYIIEKMYS